MVPIAKLRTTERARLLGRLQEALEGDARVVAAWLYGSYGRGEEDAWSDLDVWIVVRDEAYDPSLRHELPERLGEALFFQEAPQNGPPGGSYLMTAYDAPTGPHLVDWYIQPLAFAVPSDSRVVLVDRAVWPSERKVASAPPELAWSSEEDAANRAALFWAMAMIQAKYIARKPVEAGMGFEGFLLSLLRGVAEWRGIDLDETETPDLEHAAEKLDRLRRLGDRMREVAPEFAGPKEAVDRFLATVAAATA